MNRFEMFTGEENFTAPREYVEGNEDEYIQATLGVGNTNGLPQRAKKPLAKFIAKYAEYPTGATSQLKQALGRFQSTPENQIQFLSAFSAVEVSEEIGFTLISLARNARDQQALNDLLSKYNNILDSSEKTSEFLRGQLGEKYNTEEISEKIKGNILNRATSILRGQAVNMALSHLTTQKAKREMEFIQAESIFLATSIRTLVEQDATFDIESLKDVSVSSYDGQSLPKDMQKPLLDMYKENWREKTSPEYLKRLEDKFEKVRKSDESRFWVLTFKEKPNAFCYFQNQKNEQGEESIYFGGFNVDRRAQGGKIGELFIAKALEGEKKYGKPIVAVTNPQNTFLPKYKQLGFEIGPERDAGDRETEVDMTLNPDK